MMILQQRTVEQLEKLAAKGPKGVDAVIRVDSGYVIGVPPVEGRGAGASFSLENYDRYSVTMQHLEVYDNSLVIDSQDSQAYLEQCVARVCDSISYLEEKLILLELDPVEGVAQLRSEPPLSEQDEEQRVYWELVVQTRPHPRAKLARYRWTAGKGDRENLIYPATFVTLGRLTKDLAATLAAAAKELQV
jgi:hypothetical protein